MYAVVREFDSRFIREHSEMCRLTPHDVTVVLQELYSDGDLLRLYRVVRLGPTGLVEPVCRGDRWCEPKLGMVSR